MLLFQIKQSIANEYICEICTDKCIQAYLFIYKSKKSFKILATCLQDMTVNVEHTLQDPQLEEFEKSMICLSLETILKQDGIIDNFNDSVKDFICNKCNRQFASHSGLVNHMETHKTQSNTDGVVPSVKYDKLSIIKCPSCDLILLNTELDEHKKLHDLKTWHCSLCDENFYSMLCFDTHLKEVHDKTKESLIFCDFCIKSFFSNELLQQHKCKYRCLECPVMPCVHHKYLVSYRNQKEGGSQRVQCIDCDFVCVKRISMISHVNVDHLQRFDVLCNICGLAFQSKPALRQHKLKFHKEVFHCEYCSECFGSQQLLDKHKPGCAEIEKPYMCDVCNATFLYEDIMEKHKEDHFSTNYTCSDCALKFRSENELNNHKVTYHTFTISCSMCIEDFNNEDEYREHIKTHPPGTQHMCRVCDAKFNSKINHGKHVKWHTMSLHKRQCPTCSKYINAAYFRAHVDSHSKYKGLKSIRKKKLIKNYECDLCGKKFVNFNVMKRHKEIHKEHVQCDVCQKYVKPVFLERHMDEHNDQSDGKKKTAKKVFKCNKCDYETNFPLCLEAHENRRHLKIRPYKCEVCGKDFHARNHLSEHMKSHRDGNEYRKTCSICGNLFANSQCLKKHMRIHTGERPYPCEICDERFMTASRRQDHIIRRHSIPEVACPVCQNLYHTVRDVRAHIKKAHCHIQKGVGATFVMEEIPEEHRHIFKDHRRSD